MRFLIISPPQGRTGGLEALHQLAHMLRELGAHAAMLYMQEVRGELLPVPEAGGLYADLYPHLPVARPDDLGPETIVVLPEVWGHGALALARHGPVLIWWLSVDNGLLALGRTRCFLDQFRSHPRIFHAYQSVYARAFLSSLGLNGHGLALSDYVRLQGQGSPPATRADGGDQPLHICFNPLKGAWLAKAFKDDHPQLQTTPLCGMDADAIATALHACDAYIDFGHLPGKDRLPREALKAGTRVFLRQCGDGVHASDWLLPEQAYFSTEDCFNGSLIQRLRDRALAGHPPWQAARAKVDDERNVFRKECETLIDFFRRHITLSPASDRLLAAIDQTNYFADELTRTERSYFAMHSSMSWKLTSPLRRAVAALRGGGAHFQD